VTSEAYRVIHEESVRERYSAAARSVEGALCCKVTFDPKLLEALPQEIIDKDYGCGDPTMFVRPGHRVLDLGSGAGKVCYIAAQLVGPQGRVVGVDCNLEMLDLARRHCGEVANRLGYRNVEFRCGLIQDLRLDLDLLAVELAANPVKDQRGWLNLRLTEERLRRERPLIADASMDCVLSNCVLNLVRPQDRPQLFAEIFRVLQPKGQAAISDIVSSKDVPETMRQDARLWSGCISGSFREDRFLTAFCDAGFQDVRVVARQVEPWHTIDGIEFRALTVLASKGRADSLELRDLASCCGPQTCCQP